MKKIVKIVVVCLVDVCQFVMMFVMIEILLELGCNCWCIEYVMWVIVIVDVDEYFKVVCVVMMKVKMQILLVGWDFDVCIWFGGDVDDGGLEWVGVFISWLVKCMFGFYIYILCWDIGVIKMLFYGQMLMWIVCWICDLQVYLWFDGYYLLVGLYYQKVVVIDDDIVFCGGIDMIVDCWDICVYVDDEFCWIELDGLFYGLWYDVMMMLKGLIVRVLGDMCCECWVVLGGGDLVMVQWYDVDCWFEYVKFDFIDVEVGIVLIIFEMVEQLFCYEIEVLYVDLIVCIRCCFYVESQYFVLCKVVEVIVKWLCEFDGFEFVIVYLIIVEGWLELIVMDLVCVWLVEVLYEQDLYNCLWLYYLFIVGGQLIYVYVKVMVIDDVVLCVGLLNFNNCLL